MRWPPSLRSRRLVGDRGQSSVELIGYIPYILFVFFIVVEAFAYIMTIEEVDSAARAGARVEARSLAGGTQAAYGALPDRLHNSHTKVHVYSAGTTAHARVTARVPQLFGFPINWTVTREAHIPVG